MHPFTVGPEHHLRHTPTNLRTLTAFLRINALACITSANHGWIGASFSVADILTALYFGLGERQVILSKGHAAAAQYAALHGLGLLSSAALLACQDGPAAPQAHADRGTPGILLDSGSLGQALSQTIGLVLGGHPARFFVILGDGELQEGQVWEALQSLSHRGLRQIEVLIDINGFQSARSVSAIKCIPSLAKTLEGFGFSVSSVDGHDTGALVEILGAPPGRRPRVVLAQTRKAGGSRFLLPEGAVQPWHGRVPDPALAREICAEQVELAGDPQVTAAFAAWPAPGAIHPASDPAPPSTRDAFAHRLTTLLDQVPALCVLDADLADSCRIGPLFDPDGPVALRGQAFEMGISEQDMVSCAGGLALAGRIPVVSTYAAFLARAIEQVRANTAMGARIIYAGHYAGLGYFSDGRSHQSLDDLLRFQGIPGLELLEPTTVAQAAALLDWAVRQAPGSVYLRLHRTGQDLSLTAAHHGPFDSSDPRAPLLWGHGFRKALVTMGPVAARLGIEALAEPDFPDWGLVAVCALDTRERAAWRKVLEPLEQVVVVEETWAPGVLRPWLDDLLLTLSLRPERRALQPRTWGASFRSLTACRAHFGFTVEELRRVSGG